MPSYSITVSKENIVKALIPLAALMEDDDAYLANRDSYGDLGSALLHIIELVDYALCHRDLPKLYDDIAPTQLVTEEDLWFLLARDMRFLADKIDVWTEMPSSD